MSRSTLRHGRLIGLLALWLAGCATAVRYVPPEGPDVATLRIVNGTPGTVEVAGFQVAADCSKPFPQFFDARFKDARGDLVLPVAPGRPFSFLLRYHRMDYSAIDSVDVPMTFVPQPGRAYRLLFEIEGEQYRARLHSSDGGVDSAEPGLRIRKFLKPSAPESEGPYCE